MTDLPDDCDLGDDSDLDCFLKDIQGSVYEVSK